jgi:hypothetical protein
VWCDICWTQWDMRDPGVRWLAFDRVWMCADEVACFGRRHAIAVLPDLEGVWPS